MVITLEYNVENTIEAAKQEGIGEGIEKGEERGKKKVQNYVLELMAKGLSYEEIKKKIEEVS